jgi:hypothetical protein
VSIVGSSAAEATPKVENGTIMEAIKIKSKTLIMGLYFLMLWVISLSSQNFFIDADCFMVNSVHKPSLRALANNNILSLFDLKPNTKTLGALSIVFKLTIPTSPNTKARNSNINDMSKPEIYRSKRIKTETPLANKTDLTTTLQFSTKKKKWKKQLTLAVDCHIVDVDCA